MKHIYVFLIFLTVTIPIVAGQLRTEGRRWDTHQLTFQGPKLSETGTPNPFTDFRLDCRFIHIFSGVSFVVPGFFAADGNAAQTSATSGNVWIVRFTPPRTGRWKYRVRFITGPMVAVNGKGRAAYFNGENGEFMVKETTVRWPDLRSRGRLQYVGQRYFRFANGQHFLKLGTNSPENLLGYSDFDNARILPGTKRARHNFANHVRDWREGDPTWGKSKRGKGIIGAINYLHDERVNTLFAILMTVRGDSFGDVFPWIAQEQFLRFDVSKLEQWQIVFEYCTKKGLALHLSFLETENEALFEFMQKVSTKKGFADARKLFYRELLARFSHNIGFTMTLGEENGWNEDESPSGHAGQDWGAGNTDLQRQEFTYYIRSIDPYDCPILVHTYPPLKSVVYDPLLNRTRARVEGASLQFGRMESTNWETQFWLSRSANSGRQWVVSGDEFAGGSLKGVGGVPLSKYSDKVGESYRAQFAWGNVLAGGSGIELYSASVDQTLDDFRELGWAWAEFSRIQALFEKHFIPFWAMNTHNMLVGAIEQKDKKNSLYCLAKPGEVYVIYAGSGVGGLLLDLSGWKGARFQVRWFSPRKHEKNLLLRGTTPVVTGGSRKARLGKPPGPKRNSELDWVIVVARAIPFDNKTRLFNTASPRDLIPGAMTLGKSAESWD